ncbi:LLM class flavin-dependent oxidoreductase [Amaricoccus solimangrovi]|uniref:LLM class flavin-dependent oxidoreductase n=1 Tax=Amaricoccus solimangrovi TaxID=2589815 RepID=A0A501WWP0_9RHOB|nr:LLM class flavin-dependent oxidoreductase [Amaricoccus solimangrovi]TPE53142.1 LLM class flavin-dependent oxidoreductase [Amaricoccus solimangrovi]
MELGLYTFGDVGFDRASGLRVDPAERLRNLIEEITLADQLGLDVFGLGEHHRPDYAVSAPAVALAAAAAATKRIRLTSAVSVLSSDDPVRVFQQFATLDNLSGGRAEIMAGRGSFIESFPLFGYDLKDYDTLFAEKLALLMALNEGEFVTWPGGEHTPAIEGRGVYPRPVNGAIPIWLAVGGTPQSVARAGMLGLPVALAIIGGEPARFAPLFDLYRRAAEQAEADPARLRTSINVHGFVGETSQAAGDIFYGPQAAVMDRIGRERGWPPTSRAQFEAARSPRGALFVGSPQEVTEKILAAHEVFGMDRFLLQQAIGLVPHRDLMKAIELYGDRVAPAVRKALGDGGQMSALRAP